MPPKKGQPLWHVQPFLLKIVQQLLGSSHPFFALRPQKHVGDVAVFKRAGAESSAQTFGFQGENALLALLVTGNYLRDISPKCRIF